MVGTRFGAGVDIGKNVHITLPVLLNMPISDMAFSMDKAPYVLARTWKRSSSNKASKEGLKDYERFKFGGVHWDTCFG